MTDAIQLSIEILLRKENSNFFMTWKFMHESVKRTRDWVRFEKCDIYIVITFFRYTKIKFLQNQCLFTSILVTKCQLNSEWIYEVVVSPKMPTKKLTRFLPYPLINFQGRNLGNFWLAFWEKRWPHKFILNLTDL